MSAKQREDTIARFSVPLKSAHEESPITSPCKDEVNLDPSKHFKAAMAAGAGRFAVNFDFDSDVECALGTSDKDGDFTDEYTEDEPRAKTRAKGKGKSVPKARLSRKRVVEDNDFMHAGGTNPVVMLISLKAGALGLNLTAANNVFLLDPWWQEGIESQAIDRCNR